MKTTLRNITLFFMLAVFLAGMNGVSFYVHECRSSNLHEVFAFREIFEQRGSCCCEDDKPATIPEDNVLSINQPECCKSTYIYLKASITALRNISQCEDEYPPYEAAAEVPGYLPVNESSATNLVAPVIHHPPPLSGRSLVLYLHQIKIPVSIS